MNLPELPLLLWQAESDGAWAELGGAWAGLLGRPFAELRGWGWCDALAAGGRETVVEVYAAAIRAGQPGRADARFLTPGGEVWLRLAWTPGPGGAVGQATPIDDLKQAISAAETRQSRLQHRVKNNLQVVISLLSLQAYSLKDPPLRALLEDAVQRVRAVAAIQDQVFLSANLAQVLVGPPLAALAEQLGRPEIVGEAVRSHPAALPGDRATAVILLTNEVLGALNRLRTATGEAVRLSLELHHADADLVLTIRATELEQVMLDPLVERLVGLLARQVRGAITRPAGALQLTLPLTEP